LFCVSSNQRCRSFFFFHLRRAHLHPKLGMTCLHHHHEW
jgi:hypothetical protein